MIPARSTGSEVTTRSRSPRARAGSGAKENPEARSSSTSGQASRNWSMVGISHWKQLWHSMAMCRRPAVPPANRAMSRSAARSSGKVASASCSRRKPALVKRTGLVLRTNSGIPMRSSSSLN
ncbi:hypothetical protein D3C75_857620 [compost metagenome]